MVKLRGTLKNKKQLKNIQIKQQIVVCANCQHHFKIANIEPTPTIYKGQNFSDKDITQNYNRLALKNSKKISESIVDWQEIPIKQKNQLILIQGLRKSQLASIQKLKTLNNINELKKSRLLAQTSMMRTFSQVNTFSAQKYHITNHQKEVEEQIIKNQNDPIAKATSTTDLNPKAFSKTAKTLNENHRQVDSYCIFEQSLQKNIAIQILDYILQWIQAYSLGQDLPGFIKLMITNYCTIRKSKQSSFHPLFKQ